MSKINVLFGMQKLPKIIYTRVHVFIVCIFSLLSQWSIKLIMGQTDNDLYRKCDFVLYKWYCIQFTKVYMKIDPLELLGSFFLSL